MASCLSRVLYVEDDEDIAFLIEMSLRNVGGFDVLHCGSGAAALAALPGFAPQLVLLDVMMPGMDGLETFQRIRETPEGRDIPIVFMTAKVQNHQQQHYLDMGAIGVLPKPVDTDAIADRLTALWERANAIA